MKTKKRAKIASSHVFAAFSLLLFLVLDPYFLPNRYFKMTIGKMFFFYGATFIFSLGCLIALLTKKPERKLQRTKLNLTDLFGALFFISAIVSCVLSPYRLEALSGNSGRYMGLLTLLFAWVAFFFIARFGRFTPTVATVFGISIIGMNVVALLQYRGYDPFGLYVGTQPFVRTNFMSLVGNKDVYYSYLALSAPFAMYMAYDAATLKEKIFWHAVELSCFAGSFACNSDGVFLALLAAFLLLFFVKAKDKAGLLCFVLSVMMFFGGALLAALIKPDLSQFGIIENIVTRLFLKPVICFGALAFVAVIYVLLWKLRLSPVFFKALRIAVACLAGICFVGVLGAFIWFTFFDTTKDIGELSDLLRFDSLSWGNKRAYIWSRLYGIFKELPLIRMLFGSGEETIVLLMENRYGDEMVRLTNMVFDNAHNEFLHYLLTIGIVGLIAYLLFCVSAIRSAWRRSGRLCKAAALCCICYLAQSCVNISQSITTPLFFVFLALTQANETPLLNKKVRTETPEAEETEGVETEQTEIEAAQTAAEIN